VEITPYIIAEAHTSTDKYYREVLSLIVKHKTPSNTTSILLSRTADTIFAEIASSKEIYYGPAHCVAHVKGDMRIRRSSAGDP
jgi:hypothetical protein